jgi:hypothetical protein
MLFCSSVDGFIGVPFLSVDGFIGVALSLCWWFYWCCFVHLYQWKHRQIDKTTPIKTSTYRQNNTNTYINR